MKSRATCEGQRELGAIPGSEMGGDALAGDALAGRKAREIKVRVPASSEVGAAERVRGRRVDDDRGGVVDVEVGVQCSHHATKRR
jgi:hypothetical protein